MQKLKIVRAEIDPKKQIQDLRIKSPRVGRGGRLIKERKRNRVLKLLVIERPIHRQTRLVSCKEEKMKNSRGYFKSSLRKLKLKQISSRVSDIKHKEKKN